MIRDSFGDIQKREHRFVHSGGLNNRFANANGPENRFVNPRALPNVFAISSGPRMQRAILGPKIAKEWLLGSMLGPKMVPDSRQRVQKYICIHLSIYLSGVPRSP